MKALRICITTIGLGLFLFGLAGCAPMKTQPRSDSYQVATLGATTCRGSLLGCY